VSLGPTSRVPPSITSHRCATSEVSLWVDDRGLVGTRDRKIHTINLYWFTLSQELHLVPIKPTRIPLCNHNTFITTHTHQSGDLEAFKNTYHLWETQHWIKNTLWICTPIIITEIQLLRENEWSHLIQWQFEKKKIQCNLIPLLEKSLKQISEKLIWKI